MLIRIISTFIALQVSFAAFGDSPSIKVIPASGGNIFTLVYQTSPTGPVRVSIVNTKRDVVFTETINETIGFTRPYNFSQLDKGEYKIIVQDRSGRQEQIVKYGMSEQKAYIKIAEMNKEESRFVLNVGTPSSQKIMVRIYDNAKGLVHEQELEVNGNYGLIYNLSKVRSSNSSIVMFEVSTASGEVQTAMF